MLRDIVIARILEEQLRSVANGVANANGFIAGGISEFCINHIGSVRLRKINIGFFSTSEVVPIPTLSAVRSGRDVDPFWFEEKITGKDRSGKISFHLQAICRRGATGESDVLSGELGKKKITSDAQ